MKEGSRGYLAAALGASCCVLPLALLALGLGGSVLTVFLVRYKAYLMTAAGAALLFAWAHYARDAGRCASQMCEVAGGRLRKWMLGANTALVVFFFLINYTPLGAPFGVNVVGEGVLQAGAALPGGGPVAEAGSGDVPSARSDGATRLERLALRVEGMT